MKNRIPNQKGPAIEDLSADITCHLGTAKAIADLVEAACGSAADGSESLIEELAPTTLKAAMFAIQEHIQLAEDLQRRQDKFERRLGVREASNG